MIIKNITVSEFGPLADLAVDLGNGINVIEGNNGSGKSSLLSFVRFILYGLPSKRGEAGAADRERALSWKSNTAAGSITVSANGAEYRIERRATIGARDNCIDRVKMIDMATGTEVHRGEVPGVVLLGVSQAVFDSTACVRQLDSGALDAAGVSEAIENILFSADADISVKNALQKLGAAKRSLKNARGDGKLGTLERRREELTRRLERAESAARGIREAEAQAEKCRRMSAEIRHSLNANEDREAAYDALMTMRRFDILHAGERRIDELRGEISKLEADCGMGGYLPDRSYAPALDAAAHRIDDAAADRAETADAITRIRGGRMINSDAADRGDAAVQKLGADYDDDTPARYASLCRTRKKCRGFGIPPTVAGSLVTVAGILTVCGVIPAIVTAIGAKTLGISIAAAGLALTAIGIVLLLIGRRASRRAAEICRIFFAANDPIYTDKEGKAPLVTSDELEERILFCATASRERAELTDITSQLELTLAKKDAALDAAVKEGAMLLRRAGMDIGENSPEVMVKTLTSLSQRAGAFCDSREALCRDIEKYSASVSESRRELAGDDEDQLRARWSQAVAALDGQSPGDIKKACQFDRARLESTEERRVELEKRLAALEAMAEDPARISAELKTVTDEECTLRRKYDAVCMAAEAIEGAGESLRSGITPKLRRDAGEIMSRLTDGEYTELGVGTDMSVTVGTEYGTKGLSALSVGTRDGAYFALRSALVKLLFPHSPPPLMLDESLVMMDDERAERLLMSLASRSEAADGGGQCLLFTCHDRESTMLSRLGIDFKHVKI